MYKLEVETHDGKLVYATFEDYDSAWDARDLAMDLGAYHVRVTCTDGKCPHCRSECRHMATVGNDSELNLV